MARKLRNAAVLDKIDGIEREIAKLKRRDLKVKEVGKVLREHTA